MENDEYKPVEVKLPSPEELFHADESEECQPVRRKKCQQIPRYKKVKHFSAGFIFILVIIIVVLLNLNKFGISYYYMESSSMEHAIPKGSFLFVHKTNVEKLEVKDIITFMNSDNISVTHVIVEVIPDYKGTLGFRTKGTENVEWDEEIVAAEDVCGKVVFHIPYLGRWLSVLKEVTGGERTCE